MSLHKPERQPNESFADYKIRRKMAKDLVRFAKTGQLNRGQVKLLDAFKRGEIK
jgi:hypothetical protein